jgi:hypothetical protein
MSSELEVPAASDPVPLSDHDRSLEEEKAAERLLLRAVVMGTVIATPICIAVWMLIVTLAIKGESGLDWWQWLGIASVVGVFAGAFFGGWAGFVAKAHVLDEVDRRSAHH